MERVVGVYVIKKKVRVENTALAASKDTEESGERASEGEKGREAEVEEVDEGVRRRRSRRRRRRRRSGGGGAVSAGRH